MDPKIRNKWTFIAFNNMTYLAVFMTWFIPAMFLSLVPRRDGTAQVIYLCLSIAILLVYAYFLRRAHNNRFVFDPDTRTVRYRHEGAWHSAPMTNVKFRFAIATSQTRRGAIELSVDSQAWIPVLRLDSSVHSASRRWVPEPSGFARALDHYNIPWERVGVHPEAQARIDQLRKHRPNLGPVSSTD